MAEPQIPPIISFVARFLHVIFAEEPDLDTLPLSRLQRERRLLDPAAAGARQLQLRYNEGVERHRLRLATHLAELQSHLWPVLLLAEPDDTCTSLEWHARVVIDFDGPPDRALTVELLQEDNAWHFHDLLYERERRAENWHTDPAEALSLGESRLASFKQADLDVKAYWGSATDGADAARSTDIMPVASESQQDEALQRALSSIYELWRQTRGLGRAEASALFLQVAQDMVAFAR